MLRTIKLHLPICIFWLLMIGLMMQWSFETEQIVPVWENTEPRPSGDCLMLPAGTAALWNLIFCYCMEVLGVFPSSFPTHLSSSGSMSLIAKSLQVFFARKRDWISFSKLCEWHFGVDRLPPLLYGFHWNLQYRRKDRKASCSASVRYQIQVGLCKISISR